MPFIEFSSDIEKFSQPGVNILGAIIMIIVSPFLPWPTVGMVVLWIGIVAIPGTIIIAVFYAKRGYVLLDKNNLQNFSKMGGEKYRFPYGEETKLQFTINPNKLSVDVSKIIDEIDRNLLFEKINSHLEEYHQIIFNNKDGIELAIEDKTEHLYISLQSFPNISYWSKADVIVSTVAIFSLTINETFFEEIKDVDP